MFKYSVYPSTAYVIAFAVSFWSWFLFEMWVYSRDRKRPAGSVVRGGGRVFLGLAVGMTLAVNLPALAPLFDVRTGFTIVFVLGIVLIWAGLLFRFWSIQTLGNLFSTRLEIQQGHELVTRGPYKVLRNPSYTGGMITFTGIGLAIGNWLSLAVIVLLTLTMYVLRIRVEGRMLEAAFGQAYTDYKKKTWALIPFIW